MDSSRNHNLTNSNSLLQPDIQDVATNGLNDSNIHVSFTSASQSSSGSAVNFHLPSQLSSGSSVSSSNSLPLNLCHRQLNTSRSSNHRNNSSILNTSTFSNVGQQSSSFYQTEIIMSIVEGRGKAKSEIGIAYLDLGNPILHVAQFMDNYSFDSLKTQCSVCSPVEIIFPHTLTENNAMMAALIEHFPDIDFRPFERRYFNEKKGFEFIQTLSFDDCQWIDLQLENKYYCLAACSALYQYIFTVKQIQYAPKSIKIIYQSSLNTLIIDPTSAKILELIINLSNPKSSDTLFGTINRTKTKSGYMLLRSSILQPSTSLSLITKRLDMIEAITSSITNFNSFEMILTNFSDVDLDQLLVNLVQLPTYSSTSFIRLAEKKIDYVINMKHAISLVDQLRQTLSECDQTLFGDYIQRLNNNQYINIQKLIDQVINGKTKFSKGASNMKLEKCFAIKDRFNPLLDLARGIYSETIDDIIALVQAYETKYYSDGIKINYSTLKGFYMQIKQVKNCQMSKLPTLFKHITVTKNNIQFTSDDLMRLNNRIKQTVEEIYLQSDNIITKLINDIRSNISCLYDLAEIVANIDLIFSFASQCSCCNYVRPNFSTKYTQIINATHPVLDKISAQSVPNSLMMSDDENFHIITGPNMSGKTTFIKQLALLQIMAQIGSFVPAEHGTTFRLCDRLFTRMAFNDNLQMNSSAFMVEIKELHYILTNLSPNCLILIDELGKDNTFDDAFNYNNSDLTTISQHSSYSTYWSICEALLLQPSSYTVLATHFIHLTTLANYYLNVTNHHFSSEIIENNTICKYPHILLPGPTKERFYGIKLAEISGLHPDIIAQAKHISKQMAKRTPALYNIADCQQLNNNNNQNEELDKICENKAKYKIACNLIRMINDKHDIEKTLQLNVFSDLALDYEHFKKQFKMQLSFQEKME